MPQSRNSEFVNDKFVESFTSIADARICNNFLQVLMKPFEVLGKVAHQEELQFDYTQSLLENSFHQQLGKAIELCYPELVKLYKPIRYLRAPGLPSESLTISRLFHESDTSDYLKVSDLGRISPTKAIVLAGKLDSIKRTWKDITRDLPHVNDEFAKAFLQLDSNRFSKAFQAHLKARTKNNLISLTERDIRHHLVDFIRTVHRDIWNLLTVKSPRFSSEENSLSIILFSDHYSDDLELSETLFSEISKRINTLLEQLHREIQHDRQSKFKKRADKIANQLSKKHFVLITRTKLVAFLIAQHIPEEELTSLYGITVWIDYINTKLRHSVGT